MRILLYMLGGAGDIINTTGVISQLKAQHLDFKLDFLCYKKHHFLVKNHPAIDNILFAEDFNIGKLSLPDEIDGKIPLPLSSNYDKNINMWSRKYQGDFPLSKVKILSDNNIILKIKRSDINGVLFSNVEDYDVIENFSNTYLKNNKDKKVVLIEDNSYNASLFGNDSQSKQIISQQEISEKLSARDFLVISNNLPNTIHCNELNLIQIKLLFQEYCDIFLGLSSGMTTTFFTEGNYKDKIFIISGKPEWNYCKYINSMQKYAYLKNYTWETLNANFRIFDRSTKCSESENVECAGITI